MSSSELAQLETAAASGRSGAAKELLRYLRKEKLRRPDLVVRHGLPLLQAPGRLGDEQYSVYEQVFKAALDEARDDVADMCLTALEKRFPGSTRVRLLAAMHAEYLGDWDDAEAVYKDILEENPANVLALKRQVAVAKGQNKLPAAIKLLSTYVETFAADSEAWQELGELHATIGNYEAACFCYEELVLLLPRSPHHHCRLAELYQTVAGGAAAADAGASLLKARKHFAASLECGPKGNTRALLGMCAACVAVAGAASRASGGRGGGGGSDAANAAEVNAALHAFAAERLLKEYRVAPAVVRTAMEDTLAAQAAWVAPGAA